MKQLIRRKSNSSNGVSFFIATPLPPEEKTPENSGVKAAKRKRRKKPEQKVYALWSYYL